MVANRTGGVRPSARALRLAVVVVLSATACGGPRRAIEVSVQEFPGDVAIGKKALVTSPTVPRSAVNPEPIGFPPFLQPPPPLSPVVAGPAPSGPTTTGPRVQLPKGGCRTASPVDQPKKDATKNVIAPPRSASTVFRNTGTFQETTRAGAVRQGTFPPITVRSVASMRLADGIFEYVVVERTGPSETATIYYLDLAKGLYLREVSTKQADGSSDRFRTERPDALLLLPLPVVPGAQVGGTALNASTATSLSFLGTVVGKTRVDACGTLLDAWEVQITEGRIMGPNKQVRFTSTYAIGTQYGALSLRDTVEFTCDDTVNAFCDNNKKVVTKNTAIISSEPSVGTIP